MAAIEVNHEQWGELLQKIVKALGNLRNRRIAVLGLSYKPNTNDVRESPAIRLCELLLKSGARVRAFDPIAMDVARHVLGNVRMSFAKNAYDATRQADAVLLATEWNEFRNLDLRRLRATMAGNVLLDARNAYDPEVATAAGFSYFGVGRRSGAIAKGRQTNAALAA